MTCPGGTKIVISSLLRVFMRLKTSTPQFLQVNLAVQSANRMLTIRAPQLAQ